MKELTGRHEETILIKTLEISKGDHQARGELEIQCTSPINEKNIGIGTIGPEIVEKHKDLYTKGWEKFTYRPLPAEEKEALIKKVSEEADELLAKARAKV